jgi:hypothetical protein
LFVRDQIKFSWDTRFYDVKASDVLEKGVGFCTPKSTLFVALLRASDIPARTCFANLKGSVLRGFGVPLRSVDHGFSQVFLNGGWITVDAYTVDSELVKVASKQLSEEGAADGYGIHIDGNCEWDGSSDACIQKVPKTLIEDWGVFKDAQDFYSSSNIRHNHRIPWFVPTIVSGFFLNKCNALVDQFRTKNRE